MTFAISNVNGAGTVSVTAGSTTITGTGTNFTTQIAPGSVITVSGQTRTVTAVATNTSATVDTAWATTATGVTFVRFAVITQSGTDTSLAGLSALAGVKTTVENANTPTPSRIYELPSPISRIDVTGTLTIDPLYERIAFTNQPRSVLGIGNIHNDELNSKLVVSVGGTLNIGASTVDTESQIMLRGNVWLSSDGDWAAAGSTAVLVLHQGTINWNYGAVRCDSPTYRNTATSLGYLRYADLYGSTEISRAATSGNTVVHIAPNVQFVDPKFWGVRLDTTTAAIQMAGISMLRSNSGIILRQVQADVREHSRITTSTTNSNTFTGTVSGVTYQVRNVSTGTTVLGVFAGAPANLRVRHGVDFRVTGGSSANVVMADSAGASYLTTTNASGVSTAETLVTTALYNASSFPTRYSPTNDDNFVFYAWQYDRLVGSATGLLQGLNNTSVTIGVLPDANVTLTQTQAAALTVISTLDDFYDAAKEWKTRSNITNLIYPSISTQPVAANGTQLDLGALNLVVDANATLDHDINTSTNTITIKSSALAAGTKFKGIKTTGTITFATANNLNGVAVVGNIAFNLNTATTITFSNCSVSGSVSNTGTGAITLRLANSTIGSAGSNVTAQVVTALTLTGLTAGSQIFVKNGAGTQVAYVASSGTSYTLDTTGGSGEWTWQVTRYGFFSESDTFTPAVGSATVAVALVIDPFITQASAATVAGYTTLENPDKIYDYAAYFETTNIGIALPRVATKQGQNVSLGSYNVVLNASGSWSVLENTVTIPTTAAFVPGVTIAGGLITAGDITLNAQATSAGTYAAINGNNIALAGLTNYQVLRATNAITGLPSTGTLSAAGELAFGSASTIAATGEIALSKTTLSGALAVSRATEAIVNLDDCTGAFTLTKGGAGNVKAVVSGATQRSVLPATLPSGVAIFVRCTVARFGGGAFNLVARYGTTGAYTDLGYHTNITSRTLIVEFGAPVEVAMWALGYLTFLRTFTTSTGGFSLQADMVPELDVDTSLNVSAYTEDISVSNSGNMFTAIFGVNMSIPGIDATKAIVHRLLSLESAMRAMMPPGSSAMIEVMPDEIRVNQPSVFLTLGTGVTDVSIFGYFNTVPAKLIDPDYTLNPRRVSDNLRVEIPLIKPAIDAVVMARAVRTELTTELARIDAATSTRLSASAYTAPDNSGVAAIKAKTDLLPANPAAVGSAMTLTAAYDAAKTAATQTSVNALGTPAQATALATLATTNQTEHDATQAAIAALPAAPSAAANAQAVRTELTTELARIDVAISTRSKPADVVDANIVKVTGRTITGTGTEANPWGPA